MRGVKYELGRTIHRPDGSIDLYIQLRIARWRIWLEHLKHRILHR